MKRILLSAVLLSSIGVYAQKAPEVKKSNAVGIETTEPRATLDVKGDLRVQEVKEMESTESTEVVFPDCKPCVLLIDQYGVVKREPKSKFFGGKTQGGSDSTSGGSGDSGSSGGGGSETQPGQGGSESDPNKVDGTARFSTLSDAEAFVPSFNYGNGVTVIGEVTNTGVTVEIPYTSSQAGTINAVTIPVQTGGDSKLKLKIPETTITSGSGTITATIISEGGSYTLPRVTKSDIDAQTWYKSVATFKLKVEGVSTPATITLKALGGIPDKLFGKPTNGKLEHQFVYLPVVGPDGKTWLNNNLGADYARVNNPVGGSFNPNRQATSRSDYHAYGNYFQWGRDANDGYELMNWTGSQSGSPVYPGKPWRSSSQLKDTNWNPCPNGYRLPTEKELSALRSAIGSYPNRDAFAVSSLKLTSPASRASGDGSIESADIGTYADYWTSTAGLSGYAWRLFMNADTAATADNSVSYGFSVRCLEK